MRIPAPASARGMTLAEVLVTLTIFLFLAMMMMMLVQNTVRAWTKTERDRVLYERATAALDRLAGDLALTLGVEPAGVDTVLVRFYGDVDPKTGSPLLMFVRSFEAGPERALTMSAGDGQPTNLAFQPGPAGAAPARRRGGGVDGDDYTGKAVGDFKPLGGMAQVAYFVQDRILYRAIHAPVGPAFAGLLNPGAATPVSEDVLYFDVQYWGQDTATWNERPGRAKEGPQRLWDSTRGSTSGNLRSFYLHRDGSLNDPEDDVFPMKVRVTLTVDSPMPKCVNTKLAAEIGGGDTHLVVESTRGFPADDAYILVDDEWVHYRKKEGDEFIADLRGARGTVPAGHAEGAGVRIGQTFVRTVFLPQFREDRTTDKEWEQHRKRTRP